MNLLDAASNPHALKRARHPARMLPDTAFRSISLSSIRRRIRRESPELSGIRVNELLNGGTDLIWTSLRIGIEIIEHNLDRDQAIRTARLIGNLTAATFGERLR